MPSVTKECNDSRSGIATIGQCSPRLKGNEILHKAQGITFFFVTENTRVGFRPTSLEFADDNNVGCVA